MKILSIDVGIKNLAFCLFEKNDNAFKIKKWNIVNISEENSHICSCYENDKKKMCQNIAKFEKDNKYYCLKHSKKQCYQIPTQELNKKFINKQKIFYLQELADKYNIKYEKPIKKQDLINVINEYIYSTCFEPIISVPVSKVNLVSIGKNIRIKFDDLFDTEDVIDYVIIENQISPLANRMKSIQVMISQYFIMKNINQNIEFVSSINKLKDDLNKKVGGKGCDKGCDKGCVKAYETTGNKGCDKAYETAGDKGCDKACKTAGDKGKYNERKKKGVIKCLEELNNHHNEWIDFFKNNKKKDDLADCFLQGLWFINHNCVNEL